MTAKTADELLMQARAVLPRRPSPAQALAAQANGALLIDIRGDDQRRAGGLIPGAILLPRNALEWRCDPASPWRPPAITGRDQHLILICQQGFQSSLAAATLQRLGLAHATDLDGGFDAWAAAGLTVTPGRSGQHKQCSSQQCDLHHILIIRARHSRSGGPMMRPYRTAVTCACPRQGRITERQKMIDRNSPVCESVDCLWHRAARR